MSPKSVKEMERLLLVECREWKRVCVSLSAGTMCLNEYFDYYMDSVVLNALN